jgi:hypothetical protein
MMSRKKTIFLILSALLVIFLVWGIPYLANMYLNANAERIVGNMITRTDDFGGHEVKFGHIRLDYNFRGTFLELGDIVISPGEEIPAHKIKFNLQAENAYLTGFSWYSYWMNNSIEADSAYLHNVVVESVSPPLDELKILNDSINGGNYDLIGVDKVRFNRLSYRNIDSSNDSTRLNIANLTVSADNFRLSNQVLKDPKALFEVDLVEGYMEEAAFHFNKYRNAIFARDFSFHSSDGQILISAIELDNKLERYEYINQHEFETDWIELEHGAMEVRGFDFRSFFEQGIVHADFVQASDISMDIFRDKRKPLDTSRETTMLHGLVRHIPFPILIKTFRMSNGEFAYDERQDNEAASPGSIVISQVNATLKNLTNIPHHLEALNEMDLQGEGLLMNEGKIDLNVKFFLEDEADRFHMSGSIGPMPLAAINDMIGPVTRAAISEGQLNNLFFNIYADNQEGTGEVIMKYDGLKIKILDREHRDKQNIFRRAGAFLANALVVRNNNPSSDGTLVKGEVFSQRSSSQTIFNYWWELVLSGIVSTMTGSTEAEMREKASEEGQ